MQKAEISKKLRLNTLERFERAFIRKKHFYAMMNLVDSHDTTRLFILLRWYLMTIETRKKIAEAFPTYENTSDAAKQKQYFSCVNAVLPMQVHRRSTMVMSLVW